MEVGEMGEVGLFALVKIKLKITKPRPMGQRHKCTKVPSDFNVYTNLETTLLLLNEFYELCCP